ncbi:MAG: glycosyltransferase family 1 protein, partial [Acidobacteria bacterium]|nr:glycosyltransferase family 1 protein [Acidobacteriota bacterium]
VAPGPGPTEHDGIPVVRIRSVSLPRYREVRVGLATLRLTSVLRSFRPDVVHLAAPTVLGAAGARAAAALDIPAVAVFQTDLVGFARRYGFSVAAAPLWSWARWIHRQAAVTLAPSSSTMWSLRAHGVPRVHLWQRGIDLERFSPEHRCDDLHRCYAPCGEVVVGFVGRLAKEKQVERLRGVAALPGVQVVIVGDGPERHRLEREIPTAVFTGQLTGHELARHVATFDVFAHTGLDETFCQAVQEALASGVPVVAPAAGGPLDLVSHGVNGYLWSPENPETLAGAVQHLVESPLLRRSLAGAARSSVSHRPWPVVMGQLVDWYRFAIDGGARLEQLAA